MGADGKKKLPLNIYASFFKKRLRPKGATGTRLISGQSDRMKRQADAAKELNANG